MICWVDISRSFEESDGGFLRRLGHRLAPCTDEPVGDVDVGFHVFGGGALLQEGADGDVELWVLGQFLGPLLVAIDIGERHDLPVGQDQEPFVDAGLAAGG